MMKNILFALFITILSASAAFASAEMMADLESYFAGIDGVVVQVSDNEVITDLGSNRKIVTGMQLTIYEGGEEIVHPVTGKVLGRKLGASVSATVKSVESEYSVSVLDDSSAQAPQVGDAVMIMKPVGIDIQFKNATPRDTLIVNNTLTANPVLKAGDDFVVAAERLEGGAVTYQIKQKNGATIYSNTVLPRVAAAVGPTLTNMLSNTQVVDETPYSIAAGHIYKGNIDNYVLVATLDEVRILDPRDGYSLVGMIDYDFSPIASIELADLDADGQDEIFISSVSDGSKVSSVIFKHDGYVFNIINDSLNVLFRSVNDGGVRRVFAQNVNREGDITGEITEIEYTDGYYLMGRKLRGTGGVPIFGFAVLPDGDSASQTLMSIDLNKNLRIFTFQGGTEYTSTEYYGDTSHQFENRELKSRADRMEEDLDPEYYDNLITVTPRICVLDNGDFIMVENALMTRIFAGTQIFDQSFVSMFSYRNRVLGQITKTIAQAPVIMDIWVYEEDGSQYLLALQSTNNMIRSNTGSILTFKLN